MIDLSVITAAVETLLKAGLPDTYRVYRSYEKNTVPSHATEGWVNVLRGRLSYDPQTIGGVNPWNAEPEIIVEVQRAWAKNPPSAEDKLQESEKAVMDILAANLTLSGTVGMTMGYDIDYEYNGDETMFFNSAIITIRTEVRA